MQKLHTPAVALFAFALTASAAGQTPNLDDESGQSDKASAMSMATASRPPKC